MSLTEHHVFNASSAIRSTLENELTSISDALRPGIRLSTNRAVVAQGDSLELLRSMPDHCISLVLTDPPYHVTKKTNIRGDTDFDTDSSYLQWLRDYTNEWRRVLKVNGTLFCFCSPRLAASVEMTISERFNVLSQITWTKPNEPGFDGWKQKMNKSALRKWYPHSERIIFAEPVCDKDRRASYFGAALRAARTAAGMSAKALAEAIGAYGNVNHGGAVSNWETGRNVPSREQYQKLCDVLGATSCVSTLPPYEFSIRPFHVDGTVEFTDVWTFPSVRPYRGKHPAEKPVALLEHAITATTLPGDIVLDCFGGSGTTAEAALRCGRRSVTLEIDTAWIARISNRVLNYATR